MSELIYPWAKAYHQAGWCVLPARNKIPLVPWKAYQKTRPTDDQIDEWFSDAPQDAQIALVTGSVSKVTVIDVDTHKDGCTKNPCSCEPEDPESLALSCGFSMMSITGSGGRHIFCKYESVGNSVRIAHPQLDVRSDGGIIILPPSIHSSGREYEWDPLVPWNKNNLGNMMSFPTHLKVLLKERSKVDWNDLVHGVGEGRRNSTATTLAGKLIKSFGREGLNAAWELLYSWNKEKNKPPLSDRELGQVFKSVCNLEYGESTTSDARTEPTT